MRRLIQQDLLWSGREAKQMGKVDENDLPTTEPSSYAEWHLHPISRVEHLEPTGGPGPPDTVPLGTREEAERPKSFLTHPREEYAFPILEGLWLLILILKGKLLTVSSRPWNNSS